jgi:hypothetical protein
VTLWLVAAAFVAAGNVVVIAGLRRRAVARQFAPAVLAAHGESTAPEIRKHLARMGIRIGLGSLYVVLRGLEDDGVLASRAVPGGPERNWHPRRLWRARERAS